MKAPVVLTLVLAASCAYPGVPLLPQGRYEFLAATVGREILVIGGMGADSEIVAAVEAFDADRHLWVSKSPLPTPRYFLCGAELLGKVYAVGGATGAREGQSFGIVERFDPATNAWERLPDLPHPRTHAAAVAFQGKLHVVGGCRSGEGDSASVDVFDPRSGTWSAGPDLPKPSHGIAAAVLGKTLHVLGGSEDMRGHVVLENGAWTPRAPLPIGLLFAEAEAVGEKIYLVGGGSNEGGSFRAVLEYGPSTEKWTRRADAPFDLYHFDTAVLDDRIIALGGIGLEESDPRAHRRVAVYDPKVDRWN